MSLRGDMVTLMHEARNSYLKYDLYMCVCFYTMLNYNEEESDPKFICSLCVVHGIHFYICP